MCLNSCHLFPKRFRIFRGCCGFLFFQFDQIALQLGFPFIDGLGIAVLFSILEICVYLFLGFFPVNRSVFLGYHIVVLVLAHLPQQRRHPHPAAEYIAHRAGHTESGIVGGIVYLHDIFPGQTAGFAFPHPFQHNLAQNIDNSLRFRTDSTEVHGGGILRIAVALQCAEGRGKRTRSDLPHQIAVLVPGNHVHQPGHHFHRSRLR